MNNITSRKVSTKPDARSEAQVTMLTIDWEGISPEEIRAMAEQALVVKLQGNWRKNGIPAEVTVKAADYKPGTRHAATGKGNILAAIEKMTPEEKAALLAKLTGG